MLMRVSIVLSALIFLGACATERVVTETVPVEVVKFERVPVPSDLLVLHQKSTIPESVTYGESLQLWSADRTTIDILLGQLRAIQALNDGSQ